MSAERAPRREETRTLKAGGGGGTSDGMEARVARLEAHLETLRSESAATRTDITDMRVGLATLTERAGTLAQGVTKLTMRADKADERLTTLTEQLGVLNERVTHLPTTGLMATAVGTAIALVSSVILFGEKLKALAGL